MVTSGGGVTRTKHMRARMFLVLEAVKSSRVIIQYIPTALMIADGLPNHRWKGIWLLCQDHSRSWQWVNRWALNNMYAHNTYALRVRIFTTCVEMRVFKRFKCEELWSKSKILIRRRFKRERCENWVLFLFVSLNLLTLCLSYDFKGVKHFLKVLVG